MGNYTQDPISSFSQKFDPITALAAYNDSTSLILDIRGMNDKAIIVKNTGAGALTFRILGSIDSRENGGTLEWDETQLGDTVVAPAAQSAQRFDTYYNYLKIQVKDVGGVAVIKAAATGN